MLVFWFLVRNSVVLAVYLLFSVACFFTAHEHYDMDSLWDKGGKAWKYKYKYKYRRGGKTLCALYARENCVGFMTL